MWYICVRVCIRLRVYVCVWYLAYVWVVSHVFSFWCTVKTCHRRTNTRTHSQPGRNTHNYEHVYRARNTHTYRRKRMYTFSASMTVCIGCEAAHYPRLPFIRALCIVYTLQQCERKQKFIQIDFEIFLLEIEINCWRFGWNLSMVI